LRRAAPGKEAMRNSEFQQRETVKNRYHEQSISNWLRRNYKAGVLFTNGSESGWRENNKKE